MKAVEGAGSSDLWAEFLEHEQALHDTFLRVRTPESCTLFLIEVAAFHRQFIKLQNYFIERLMNQSPLLSARGALGEPLVSEILKKWSGPRCEVENYLKTLLETAEYLHHLPDECSADFRLRLSNNNLKLDMLTNTILRQKLEGLSSPLGDEMSSGSSGLSSDDLMVINDIGYVELPAPRSSFDSEGSSSSSENLSCDGGERSVPRYTCKKPVVDEKVSILTLFSLYAVLLSVV